MLFDDIDTNIQEIITKGDFAKKESNKNNRFTVLWHNEFAPKPSIGDTNYLLKKYNILNSLDDYATYNINLAGFIKAYITDVDKEYSLETLRGSMYHGRSVEQLKHIANHISRRCNEEKITFFDGMENDIEKLMCLIIKHACMETLTGRYAELTVEDYISSFDYKRAVIPEKEESNWDTNGVDILVVDKEKKLISKFVQVKPISFILGLKPDQCADRKKCKTVNQAYVDRYIRNHPEKINKGKLNPNIIYCFYDIDERMFYNFKSRKDDKGVFIAYNDFADDNGVRKYTPSQIHKLPMVDLTNFKKKS